MPTPEEETIVCLMDMTRKQVGCVLLQAVFQGNKSLTQEIDSKHWFVAPTPDMKMYKIPKSKIPEIIDFFNKLEPYDKRKKQIKEA